MTLHSMRIIRRTVHEVSLSTQSHHQLGDHDRSNKEMKNAMQIKLSQNTMQLNA